MNSSALNPKNMDGLNQRDFVLQKNFEHYDSNVQIEDSLKNPPINKLQLKTSKLFDSQKSVVRDNDSSEMGELVTPTSPLC